MYCSVLLCDVMAFYLQVLCCVVRCREGARGARDVPDEARGEQSGRHARAQRPPARDRRAQRRAARALGLRLPRAARRHRCARATSIARHATPRHLPSRPVPSLRPPHDLRIATMCSGAVLRRSLSGRSAVIAKATHPHAQPRRVPGTALCSGLLPLSHAMQTLRPPASSLHSFIAPPPVCVQ